MKPRQACTIGIQLYLCQAERAQSFDGKLIDVINQKSATNNMLCLRRAHRLEALDRVAALGALILAEARENDRVGACTTPPARPTHDDRQSFAHKQTHTHTYTRACYSANLCSREQCCRRADAQ